MLNIIKNKKTIIALKNETIKNLKQKTTDKLNESVKQTKNDKQSIDFETKNDVSRINIKKNVKMIILFDLNKFIEKNKFRIDDWILKIENKLQKNVNFFSIKNVKIKYVQNLIDDQILHRLKFRFRKKFKNLYIIAENIIKNLRHMYDNLNRCFIAVNQFRDLRMKKTNFIDIWTEFQRLFKKFKHTNDHFFEKFIHKLISIYQKHLSMKCDNVTDLYVLTVVIKKTIEK